MDRPSLFPERLRTIIHRSWVRPQDCHVSIRDFPVLGWQLLSYTTSILQATKRERDPQPFSLEGAMAKVQIFGGVPARRPLICSAASGGKLIGPTSIVALVGSANDSAVGTLILVWCNKQGARLCCLHHVSLCSSFKAHLMLYNQRICCVLALYHVQGIDRDRQHGPCPLQGYFGPSGTVIGTRGPQWSSSSPPSGCDSQRGQHPHAIRRHQCEHAERAGGRQPARSTRSTRSAR